MATEIWNGTTSGNWDTAGNWVTIKPAANDNVSFPASATQDITSGCDNENGIDVDELWIQEGANYNLGTVSVPVYISADLLKFEGGGSKFYKAGDTGCDLAIIKARPASSGITSVTLNGTGTTDYTDIRIQQGKVTVGPTLDAVATGDVPSLRVMGDSEVTVSAGSTFTNYQQGGGVVTNHSTLTNAVICNGTFNQDTVVTGTTLDIWGGVVNILIAGTHPLINLYGGFLDLTRTSALKTVSVLNVYGGDYKTNGRVTLSAVNDYR